MWWLSLSWGYCVCPRGDLRTSHTAGRGLIHLLESGQPKSGQSRATHPEISSLTRERFVQRIEAVRGFYLFGGGRAAGSALRSAAW
jgi:hypothetical protein